MLALDTNRFIYVADRYVHKVRKVSPTGVVTTLAGSGSATWTDGTGTAAAFYQPTDVVVDTAGNVYVADMVNNRVRKITTARVVTTFAGSGSSTPVNGIGTSAAFYYPCGLAIDTSANLYVAEFYGYRVRKITPLGVATTIAGTTNGYLDGVGTSARFSNLYDVAVDTWGNLYATDNSYNQLRMISSAGVVTTLAGSTGTTAGATDGLGTSALFNAPQGIIIDSSGNLFVSDYTNNKIRKVTTYGLVVTFAGSGTYSAIDGVGSAATFRYNAGIAMDSSNTIYVVDSNNYCKNHYFR